MKITKEDNQLVLRIHLTQKSYDILDEEIGDVPNLIGVVNGDEYTISYLCDLAYKDDQQEGMAIINFPSQEMLEDVCKELGLDIWRYENCYSCKKAIRGSAVYDDKGLRCYSCK